MKERRATASEEGWEWTAVRRRRKRVERRVMKGIVYGGKGLSFEMGLVTLVGRGFWV